jgi:hypothetical protein
MRTLLGKLVARVNSAGSLWRGTVWTDAGSSSCTAMTLREAMDWCEGELRR